MNQNQPLLYSFRRCPYAMRARLAIKSSRQQVVLREITLKQKPAHMIDISPKATVPVLLLKTGDVLEESLDIMHWAFDQADPEGLRPKEKIYYDALAMDCETHFKTHLDRFKYHTRYEDVDPTFHYEKAYEYLKTISERLSGTGWMDGGRLTMTDLIIAPFIRQFSNADPDWTKNASEPLQKWLTRFVDSERFINVMEKYKPWLEDDKDILF